MPFGAIAGSLIGGAISGGAAHDAASAQRDAANTAAQTQLAMQQNALQYEQAQTSPYTQAGQTGLAAYMQQLGLTPPQYIVPSTTANPNGIYGQNASQAPAQPAMVQQPQITQQWDWVNNQPGQPTITMQSVPAQAAPATQGPSTNMVAGGTPGFNMSGDAGNASKNPNGMPTPVANGQQQPFDVSKIPGYQFQMSEAMKALQNSAAAGQGALSGNALRALAERAQGLASTQYGSYLDRLAGLASLGENAAVNAGNQGVGIIQNAGNNISSMQIGAGNAAAAGQIAQGNAIAGGVNAIGNFASSPQGQTALSNLFGSGYTPNSYGMSGSYVPGQAVDAGMF